MKAKRVIFRPTKTERYQYQQTHTKRKLLKGILRQKDLTRGKNQRSRINEEQHSDRYVGKV